MLQDQGTPRLRIEGDEGFMELTLVPQPEATPFVLTYSIHDPRPLESPLVLAAHADG